VDWISWRRGSVDLARERDYLDLVREGARLLLDEFGKTGDIVLKDPRVCRLLSFWLDVLYELGIEPLVVLSLRAPEQVALSLKRRNGIRPSYALRAWLRFTLEAERASRHVRRVVVDFDQLLDDWRTVVTALNRCSSGDVLACTADVELKVSTFLSPELRHFAGDNRDCLPAPSVARTYGILREWQERAERREDYGELDTIAAALDNASPLLIRCNMVVWCAKWLGRQRERLSAWLLPGKESV
jgi:hypothetical protein